MTEPDKPAGNVVEALSRVMGELPAIGKDSKADPKQGGYAYRGIEAITTHTQSLFAKHGIVFTPHVLSYEVRDITVNSKPWTDVYELIEYTVYGPGGAEDCIKVGPVLAIGRDNSDKGANKCMTQAFKYALLQALCISDAKDDGDHASVEADHARAAADITAAAAKKGLIDRLKKGELAHAETAAAAIWHKRFGESSEPITSAQWDALCDDADKLIAEGRAA